MKTPGPEDYAIVVALVGWHDKSSCGSLTIYRVLALAYSSLNPNRFVGAISDPGQWVVRITNLQALQRSRMASENIWMTSHWTKSKPWLSYVHSFSTTSHNCADISLVILRNSNILPCNPWCGQNINSPIFATLHWEDFSSYLLFYNLRRDYIRFKSFQSF